MIKKKKDKTEETQKNSPASAGAAIAEMDAA